MRILIPLFSPPTGTMGSLTRVVALSHAAVKRGHSVAFTASGILGERLQGKGFTVYETPAPTFFGLPNFLSKILEKRSKNISLPVKPGRDAGSIWLVLLLSGLTGKKFLQKLVRAELEAVHDFNPDYIFTEVEPGAIILSHITEIPLALTYAGVMKVGIGSFPYKKLARSIKKVCHIYGKPPLSIEDVFENPKVLKVIPSIPELEAAIPQREDYFFAGNLIDSISNRGDGDFKPEKGKRYLFCYPGTGSLSLETVRKVLGEAFPEGGDIYCLIGGVPVTGEIREGNLIMRPFFDAEKVMEFCELVICHGGHNTLIQSLLHHLPPVIIPGPIFERRFNARQIAKERAGVFLEIPEFTACNLRRILAERETYVKNARRLGEKISSCPGAEGVVAKLESVISQK